MLELAYVAAGALAMYLGVVVGQRVASGKPAFPTKVPRPVGTRRKSHG